MKAQQHKIGILLILFGLFGIILFFPWKFENGSTCVADDYFNVKSTVHPVNMNYEMRMHRYILPYGFLWWLSIAILVYAFYRFYRSGRVNKADYQS